MQMTLVPIHYRITIMSQVHHQEEYSISEAERSVIHWTALYSFLIKIEFAH